MGESGCSSLLKRIPFHGGGGPKRDHRCSFEIWLGSLALTYILCSSLKPPNLPPSLIRGGRTKSSCVVSVASYGAYSYLTTLSVRVAAVPG